ncbi:Uncharacterized protein ywmD [Beauveria bassiana D1-5]|uniref:Uncharacterized protein ywmD n=1 Tax=Beauveria bassiana D1-5 TaxID=1245745 RepID=A0A0A2VU51_BEABA|nr:Uncharacterized protein ywmD [Beauveria bassiana D1-5]
MANLFARPSAASDGAIEWYSELNGKPVPLAELSQVEAGRLEMLLKEKLAVIAELYAKLQSQGKLSADTLALLFTASTMPDRNNIWSVGGVPVITLWPVNRRTAQQAPEVVVIFDASGSMSLSMDVTPEELKRWSEQKPVANIEREPRRITLARSSANQIIDSLPKDMNISLIAAESCNRVTTTPPFPWAQRAALKASIDAIEPVGKTALAEALTKAGKMVDGVKRDAIILLITDGDETCGGDPCAVAQALKQAKPRLQINVVDIMNSGAGNCIASNTGGSVFTVNNTKEFSSMMNKALDEYIPEGCE